MAANVTANVGLKRISSSQPQSIAAATRSAREDIRRITRSLNSVIAELERVTVPALRYALRPIFEQSQEYCPIDTGMLKESGYLEVRRVDANRVQAEIGYAKGGNPHYAVFVHENLEMRHTPPTRAKFLENAVREGLSDVPMRVREYLERTIRVKSR
jgi:hypothetical protein